MGGIEGGRQRQRVMGCHYLESQAWLSFEPLLVSSGNDGVLIALLWPVRPRRNLFIIQNSLHLSPVSRSLGGWMRVCESEYAGEEWLTDYLNNGGGY